MSLKFNEKEIKKHINQIARYQYNALRKAARRGLKAAYETSWVITKDRYYHLGKNTEKNQTASYRDQTDKIARVNPTSVEIVLRAATRAFSLINSVVGSKKPRNQKGIKIANRKPLVVKIDGKRKVATGGQFIASPKKTRIHGVTQVFVRGKQGKNEGKLTKQTSHSISRVLKKDASQSKLYIEVSMAIDKAFNEVFQ